MGLLGRETGKDFLWRALQTAARQGVLFAFALYAAARLGPEDFGAYSYVLAVTMLLVVVAEFGVSAAVSKRVAEAEATAQGAVRAIVGDALVMTLATSTAALAVLVVVVEGVLGNRYLYAASPLLYLVPAASVYDGVFRGSRRFARLSLLATGAGLTGLALGLALIEAWGLVGALAAQVGLYGLLLGTLAIGYGAIQVRPTWASVRELGGYSVYIGVANVGHFLYTRVDSVVLGAFGYLVAVGHYELIYNVFLLLLVPFGILGQVIAPQVSGHYARRAYGRVYRGFVVLLVSLLGVGALLALAVAAVGLEVLGWALPQYRNEMAVQMLSLLLYVLPVKVAGTALAPGFVTATGHAGILTVNTLVFGVMNVALDYLLVLRFGYIGVVYATLCLSYASFAIAMGVYLVRVRRVASEDGPGAGRGEWRVEPGR